jgi:hypothetical protein
MRVGAIHGRGRHGGDDRRTRGCACGREAGTWLGMRRTRAELKPKRKKNSGPLFWDGQSRSEMLIPRSKFTPGRHTFINSHFY